MWHSRAGIVIRGGRFVSESALATGDWDRVYAAGRIAVYIAERVFMPAETERWVEHRRRELEDVRVRGHECCAKRALHASGSELPLGERHARTLRVYEQLRLLLRDELRVAPGREVEAGRPPTPDATRASSRRQPHAHDMARRRAARSVRIMNRRPSGPDLIEDVERVVDANSIDAAEAGLRAKARRRPASPSTGRWGSRVPAPRP